MTVAHPGRICLVVTHREEDPLVKQGGTTYRFVTGGIEPALERARGTAGDSDVVVLAAPGVTHLTFRVAK